MSLLLTSLWTAGMAAHMGGMAGLGTWRSPEEIWIEGREDDPLQPPELLPENRGFVSRDLRRLGRRLRGKRQAFTFRHFTDELVRSKLTRLGEARGFDPHDYAEAAAIGAGLRVEIEDVDEEVDLGALSDPYGRRDALDLASCAYVPETGGVVVRVPAALRDFRGPELALRIVQAIREKRLYRLYPEETLRSFLERAADYPYLYNRAIFEQVSHVAAGHPIAVSGSPGELFWPRSWAAVLPPLQSLPNDRYGDRLLALNRREAQLRGEWAVLVGAFEEVVFPPGILL